MYWPAGWQEHLNDIGVWFWALPWGGPYIFDQALMAFCLAGLILALTRTGAQVVKSLLILTSLALLVGVLGFGVPAGQLLMALHLEDTPRQAWVLAQWCGLFAALYLGCSLTGYCVGRLIRPLFRRRRGNRRRNALALRRLRWGDAL